MSKRKAIPKSVRFEVFKRDNFTCQYCGGQAPDVLLHLDHITPVAEGGLNEILNLITSCEPCNLGKGARKLSDDSAIKRQRVQIEELEARREQLEMMLQWRDQAERDRMDVVEAIGARLCERGGLIPNESGKANIRRWLKRYTLAEILEALDTSFDRYMEWNGNEPIDRSWEIAFMKIPAICSMNKSAQDKPYLPALLYIQGIIRNRAGDRRLRCVEALESLHLDGVATDDLKELACRCDNWDDFARLAEDMVPPKGDV